MSGQPGDPPAPGVHPDAAHLRAFLIHLAAERRLSGHTVEAYARDIRSLLVVSGGTRLQDLTIPEARRALAQLRTRGLSARSLARMLSAWRTFYRYLIREHGYTRNPFVGIRPPRAPKTLPQALSPDDAVRLMQIAPADVSAVRDRAMFELCYSSGLRLAELIGLRIGDVDLHDATVRATGKGGKTRIVPVGRHAIQALQEWLSQRAVLPVGAEQALFVNARGRRMSPRTVQHRLKGWGLKQGLAQPVHPHMLRHSFASHVLQSSGDLRAVQEMLGHASISTTQVYTHLDFQHLAKVYDAAHPRARKRTKRPGAGSRPDDTPAPAKKSPRDR